ncbi:G2 and S phase-expressed protein 1-like isoform X2 [Mercenaria mercenaria]|uniref:G2 and S phase-expressed protein 1-like isoform X2 n=1 Tax=Mercenaria mercenaria TaxID=6596 RepID=UPI00234E86C3|nr:G2 and S phase-expressed protein 1-like isoform X2 [Mercenaria mercenaria]
MSGCQEGILVDLSEPAEDFPVTVTDSIEYLRDDPFDRLDDVPKFSSPLKSSENLLDISTKSNTPNQPSPLRLIDAETFDFDLPLTPGTSSDKSIPEDEEEEVFFGPMGYRERCVSTVVNSVTKESKPLSPLNPRQIAEICKEANAVACRISSAASGKKGKKMPKENLFCVKQLRLDQTLFNKEAVGSLLNSVRKIKTDDADEDKENCDNHQNMDVDSNNESIQTLEAFLRNDVAELKSGSKSSSSESELCESPMKRHNRSGTYTLDKTPHDLLPADKRKSLPVVGNAGGKSLSVKPDEVQGDTGRRSMSKLQQPASKLVKSSVSGIKGPKPVSKPESKETGSSTSKIQMKSRLSAPKAGSLLPSKLKPVGTNSSSTATTSIPTKPALQKSGLPGPKGRGAPVSKLQLMRPSALQRPGCMQAKNPDSLKKNGPIKAFVPAQKQEVEKPSTVITPSKMEKKVQPKNLSSSFSTPSRTGSSSSMDSPMSSVKKRRSFLPTPTKSRLGSNGSNASPCPSRTSSTSSQKSLDSPLVRGPSSATRSATKVASFDLLDDSSPSAMRPKRQLVTNTPNMPKKKLSQWSPVQKKKPHDLIDQAIMCTKKVRR